ncbi:MAG: CDP-diacylglycerol--serine O-phosphatidyltransferase [Bacteroidales bacterium]|nr:CDP-diacylglycerol--serine O-phosphatidyltransferase [Bacteroidales bacterium]
MKKHIPNFVTSLNILCGVLSIAMTMQGNLKWAAVLVIGGAFFDFIDGFVARLLHVASPFGKQLDSLCDVVTFGVAPAFIIFSILKNNTQIECSYLPYIALITPIFSALRLAKFNIDERQSDRFFGLPVPANALFLISVPLLNENLYNGLFFNFMHNPFSLMGCIIVGSFLMVSELPLLAMKFKTWRFQDNKARYIFIALSLILILLFQFTALPMIIVLYVLISIIYSLLNH